MEWYRVFYWTCRTGSLSRAAERLHITQPAVSQTIRQLESRLGGPLFVRTARGVRPTAEGDVLFRHVEAALAAMASGEQAIAAMHGLHSGEINIGASDTLCKHYLLPYLERFHREYPDIRIRVTNRTTPETIALLREGAIDFGVVSLPVSDRHVEFRTSVPLQDCLVGGPAYAGLAVTGKPLPLEALASYPLLLLERGSSMRAFLDGYAARHGVSLAPEFELGSLDLLVQFARIGFGLAFVIRSCAEAELASGALVELPLDPPVPQRHIGIAVRRGVPLTAAARRLLELLP